MSNLQCPANLVIVVDEAAISLTGRLWEKRIARIYAAPQSTAVGRDLADGLAVDVVKMDLDPEDLTALTDIHRGETVVVIGPRAHWGVVIPDLIGRAMAADLLELSHDGDGWLL